MITRNLLLSLPGLATLTRIHARDEESAQDDCLQSQFISLDGKAVQMKMMGKPGWITVHDMKR